ncbi:anti-anti-sigma factor [Streptomyces misionensis]|uniref:Anti-anti-sigma factor n=1 Tax=Streptomyces misionensis TaxID=67331 RepID=A0A1H4MFR1_9ACTN|nr:anti-anti-sigma factor [Streptomyces misionensis]
MDRAGTAKAKGRGTAGAGEARGSGCEDAVSTRCRRRSCGRRRRCGSAVPSSWRVWPRCWGELDHTNADEPRERIATITLRPARRLVLDLAGMEFRDSSGITALIVARNHALAAQAHIALAAVPDHTTRILRIVGLDQIFTVLPDSPATDRP